MRSKLARSVSTSFGFMLVSSHLGCGLGVDELALEDDLAAEDSGGDSRFDSAEDDAAPNNGAPEGFENDAHLSWAEFVARLEEGPNPDTYIWGGDVVVGEQLLRGIYDDLHGPGIRSTVSRYVRRTQPPGRQLNLTYCVSGGLDWGIFGNRQVVVDELAKAATEWELAADVNFIYRPEYDHVCHQGSVSEDEIFFVVKGSGLNFDWGARAFFPFEDKQNRVLEINNALTWAGDPIDISWTIRHELGHILGFYHEHMWSNCPDTGEDTDYFNLIGPEDPRSLMWYPGCPGYQGGSKGNRFMSRYDALGAGFLYNKPRTGWYGRSTTAPAAALPEGEGLPVGVPGVDRYISDFNGDKRVDILWFHPTKSEIISYGTSSGWFTTSTQSIINRDEMQLFAGHFSSDLRLDFLAYNDKTPELDVVYGQLSNGTFFKQDYNLVNYLARPVVGTFNADHQTDMFWYQAYWGTSEIWQSKSDGLYSVSGAFDLGANIPISGDFTCDGYSDVLLYSPGSETHAFRRGSASGLQAVTNIGPGPYPSWAPEENSLARRPYFPMVGRFNGDNCADIYWFRPFRGDFITFGNQSAGPFHGAKTGSLYQMEGHYKPFTGDFNGDGMTDIFWYTPDSEADAIWLATSSGSFSKRSMQNVQKDFSPIVGDFDGDGDDDIFWWEPYDVDSPVWLSDGDGTFTFRGQYTNHKDYYPVGYGRTH